MHRKKRILVVDDEPDFCTVVKGNLERNGLEVEVAHDGVQCLQMVAANPPDAIVLDVMMPEKDGHAACRELKSSAQTGYIPIILLTAMATHISSTRYVDDDGTTMAADDYLPKPSPSESITASLKGLLNR